jgi:hypothetical protein
MVSEREFEAAKKRGKGVRAEQLPAISAYYDRGSRRIVIVLASGLQLSISPNDAEGLAGAKPSDLKDIEISPSGLGIHFPKLDADLYIPGLIAGAFGSQKWMAAQMGKVGGSVTSRAKATAARENGKLGGRPRKSKAFVAA